MRSCNSREFLQRFWAFLIQHCYNTRSTKSLRLNQLGDKKINNIHPTIKFTADWSYSSVNFLDVKVIMKDGKIITDLYVKPTDTHQYLDSSSCHPYHCKKVSLTAKLFALIESVLIMPSFIRDVTN